MDIATIAAVVAALAAVASAAAIVWQTRCTTSIQAILQLLAAWDSDPMFTRVRPVSATSSSVYLSRLQQYDVTIVTSPDAPKPELGSTAHIDSLLDFFETVANLTARHWYDLGRPLTFGQAYNSFYWPMACYWVLLSKYVQDAQQEEGVATWSEYSTLMKRFLKKEELPTQKSVRSFFESEEMLTGVAAGYI